MESETPISPQHAAARQWAKSGAHVFPCVPNTKRPLIDAWEAAATTDAAQIDAWWREHPNANIGCAPARSGCFVLDVDTKADKHGDLSLIGLEAEHGTLPKTFTVKTPSGGKHLWFRGKARSTTGHLGNGLDTRGDGGYVLMPGSTITGQGYAVEIASPIAASLPWLTDKLGETKHEREAAPVDVQLDAPINVARGEAYLHELVRQGDVAIEGQGGNLRTYQLTCMLRDFGLSKATVTRLIGEIWNPACKPAWDMAVLTDENPNPNACITHAFAHGQNETGSKAFNSNTEEFGDVLASSPDTSSAANIEPRTPSTTYPAPKSAAQLARGTFARAEALWGRFIFRRLVNLLYGDGGTGKTLLAEHIAVAVAAGVPLFGFETVRLPVLLALAEDDDGETKARLEAVCAVYGLNLADLAITTWCLPGYDVTLARIADTGAWQPGPFWEPLRSKLKETGECLLVLDSLADIFSLNESLRLPANTAIKQVLGSLCRELKATVLAIAHPSKAALQDGSGYAGSTAWNNAVRNRLTLDRPKDDERSPRRILRIAKSNYGTEGELMLTLSGMTFSGAGSQDQRERDARFRDACVEVAVRAAEVGCPIGGKDRPAKWVFDDIERAAGRRPSLRELKDTLWQAVRDGLLRKIEYTRHRAAGFYPPDQERAEALAVAAKHVQAEGGADV